MGQGDQRGRHTRRVMMPRLFRSAAACAAVLSMVTPAGAQIYECTDASGAREYAQVCAASTVRQRQLRADDPPAGATDTKTVPQLDAEFRKRQGERREADEKAIDERNKREEAQRNCMAARGQLKALLEGQRMQRTDPDSGARINLGDDERAADAERQKTLIAQWCN